MRHCASYLGTYECSEGKLWRCFKEDRVINFRSIDRSKGHNSGIIDVDGRQGRLRNLKRVA